jgi:hypothetical protein
MKLIVSLIALMVLLLSACGTAAPVETEALPPIETQISNPTEPSTTPESTGGEPYPAAVGPTEVDPNALSPYLAPGEEGTTISWEEAVSLIQAGKVAQVRQYDNLMVRIVLKNDQIVGAYQPAMNVVLDLIAECGDLCQDIEVKTD